LVGIGDSVGDEMIIAVFVGAGVEVEVAVGDGIGAGAQAPSRRANVIVMKTNGFMISLLFKLALFANNAAIMPYC
jgi:hypothetical protein